MSKSFLDYFSQPGDLHCSYTVTCILERWNRSLTLKLGLSMLLDGYSVDCKDNVIELTSTFKILAAVPLN